jgi:hypothetical protein
MAVFFDKPTTVFDEAPFQLAAMSPFVLPFVAAQMLLKGYSDSGKMGTEPDYAFPL